MKRLLLLLGTLAALAGGALSATPLSAPLLQTPSASAQRVKPPLSVPERGMAIGEHYAYTPEQANLNIGLMSGLGVNAVRLILKWNHTGALEPLQAASICNTA